LDSGFSVVPLKVDGSKRPAIPSWKKYQAELPTEAELRQWFSKPLAIGIICGPVSGGLAVFDFECVEAWKFFEKRAQEEGLEELLEDCPLVDTPGGGIHLFTCSPTPCGSGHKAHNPSMPSPKADSDLVAEVKAAGGYVMAPGSPANAHKAGKEYTISRMGWLQDPKGPRPLPDGVLEKLLAILKELDKGPKPPARATPRTTLQTEDKPSIAARYNSETKWEGPDGLLEPDGWTKTKGASNGQQNHSGKAHWLRPGKEGDGCSATTSDQILWVFSTSTSLPVNTPIDRFEYFALTRFGGDKHEAAKHLHAEWDKRDLAQLLAEVPQVDPVRAMKKEEPMEPFPVDALPLALQEFVLAKSECSGADPAFFALPAIAVIGGAIGQSRLIETEPGWVESCHLWTLLVAPSGTMKSPALRAAAGPAYRINQNLRDEYDEAKSSYEENLAAWKENKNGPPPDKPTQKQLVVTDATVESLLDLFPDNPQGLLLIRDEMAELFSSFLSNKYQGGTGSLSQFLEFHDSEGYVMTNRIGRASKGAKDPQISITGTIQPGRLHKYFCPTAWEAGLPQRFLFAKPDNRLHLWDDKKALDPAVTKRYWDLIQSLHDLRSTPKQVYRLSQEAKPLWVGAYNRSKREQHKLQDKNDSKRGRLTKLLTCTARWALAYQVVHNQSQGGPFSNQIQDEIGAEAMDAAIRLIGWFEREGDRLTAILEGSVLRQEEDLIVRMLTGKPDGLTAREIHKNNKSRFPKVEEAKEALDELVKKGQVRAAQYQDPKGGRPAVRYYLKS
jgi:hypothetical protein